MMSPMSGSVLEYCWLGSKVGPVPLDGVALALSKFTAIPLSGLYGSSGR